MRHPFFQGVAAVGLLGFVGSVQAAQAMTFDVDAVKVSLQKPHLVLGEDRELKLRVTAPADLGAVTLTTNVGRVADLRQQAPGLWEATYRAPTQYYPQLAFIIAMAGKGDRVAVGYRILPLWGRGEAEVKTQRRAQVTVRIGDKLFGPVRADRKGIAKVKVIVPPGVRHGWDGAREVDLKLPLIRRLYGIAVPRRYDGTRAQPVTLLLFATAPDGAPEQAVEPKLMGSTGGVRRLAPGLWRADIQAPAGKPSSVEVKAFLPTSALPPTAVSLQRVAGLPTVAKLSVVDTVADDQPIVVRVLVTDALGTPVEGSLQPVADVGEFGSVSKGDSVGDYAVRWRPPRWTAKKRARLSVSIDGRVAGSTTVPLSYPANAWRRRLHPAWFYVAAGVSGALLVSGAIARGMALDKSSEYKDPGTSIDRRRELKDSGEPLTDASSALLGIGAAAVVGLAVIYYFTDWGYARERLALQPGGRTLLLSGRF